MIRAYGIEEVVDWAGVAGTGVVIEWAVGEVWVVADQVCKGVSEYYISCILHISHVGE